MPIQHAIWTVSGKPLPLSAGRRPYEQKLEEMIVQDPCILSSEWMLIARQETTSHGGRIDLLAIAPDGSLVLIELCFNQDAESRAHAHNVHLRLSSVPSFMWDNLACEVTCLC